MCICANGILPKALVLDPALQKYQGMNWPLVIFFLFFRVWVCFAYGAAGGHDGFGFELL